MFNMNSLLEYQLKSLGYTGTFTEEKLLTFINLVNDTYNKSDENRAYQRKMLEYAKDKINKLHALSLEEKKNRIFFMEEKYKRLLKNLQPNYFFYTKNNEGRFTSISDSVFNMLGFNTEEFMEKYSDIFSYGLRSDIKSKMLISEYGYNVPYEVIVQNNLGTDFYLEVTEYPIFDDRNNILGIEGIVRNITEHKVHQKRITNMLYSDTLTGISNRLHLEIMMEKLIAENEKSKNTFSMLYLDIDHFKHINDTLGHDVGDILLQKVVYSINAVIRASDIFARIGGDEFVIIFKDIKKKKLEQIIDKLMYVIQNIHTINGYELHVTSSIGVVMFPYDGVSTVDLMKRADIAMYQSKKKGRNTYTFFDEKYSELLQDEMQLMQDMSQAIDNNEFELYYQPKVLVKNNKVIAAEALIRWNHTFYGYILPNKFIALAENTGLILKLGRWVIREVCVFLHSLNTLHKNKDFSVAINISIRQFQHGNLYKSLKENIEKYDIDGTQISIEITESIMMENVDSMIKIINKIKKLGVHISLDDFGTGYSTLSYLSKLSIDELKIDKAFVDKILQDGTNTIVLDTIIAMGKTLNMSVVAEGVEHEYQRKYLEDKGCDIYQGHLFSKALPEKEYISTQFN